MQQTNRIYVLFNEIEYCEIDISEADFYLLNRAEYSYYQVSYQVSLF